MVQLNIQTNELPTEISSGFTPLPNGTYQALLVDVDQQEDGSVKFQIDITSGENVGRKHFEWHNFTVDNPDLQWKVENALQFVGSLAHAVGASDEFNNSKDTTCLINKPFLMDLKVHQGKNYTDKKTGMEKTPNPKNLITGIHAFSNAPSKSAAASPAAPSGSEGEGAAWRR